MRITCQRESLLAAFQTAATVAPLRSPKSIIRNVKLEVAGDTLTVMATDMEVGIRIEIGNVEVEQEGSAVVPVSQFGGVLRESTDEKLRIEADLQSTLVRGERSEIRLSAVNPDEFPPVARFEGTSFHEEENDAAQKRAGRCQLTQTTLSKHHITQRGHKMTTPNARQHRANVRNAYSCETDPAVILQGWKNAIERGDTKSAEWIRECLEELMQEEEDFASA